MVKTAKSFGGGHPEASVFGSQKLSHSELSAKIIEDTDFFSGHLLLLHTCRHQQPMYGIPILVRRWNLKY